MYAYIIMYVVVLAAFLNKDKKIWGEIAFFTLLFFSLFRGDLVGIDTRGAMEWSQIVYRANIDFDWFNLRTYEITTNFIYKLIYYLGFPERLIICFYSITTFIFLRLLSNRMNIDLVIMMTVFLLGVAYIHAFNIARQYTAIAVMGYAVSFLYEKDFKKSLLFYIFILFAISIHSTSVIFIPLYFLRNIVVKKKWMFTFIVLGVFLSLFGLLNMRSLMSFALSFNAMEIYSEAYSHGISKEKYISFWGWLSKLGVLFIKIFILNKIYTSYKFSLLFAFAIFIGLITSDIGGAIGRLFMGVNFLSLVFIGYYLSNYHNFYIKGIFIVLYSYLFFRNILDTYYFCF